MSLIHDALKSMDEPAYAGQDPVTRSSRQDKQARPAWQYSLLAFVAVTGAGALGWALWQGQVDSRASLVQAAAAVAMPDAPAPADPLATAAASYVELQQNTQPATAQEGLVAELGQPQALPHADAVAAEELPLQTAAAQTKPEPAAASSSSTRASHRPVVRSSAASPSRVREAAKPPAVASPVATAPAVEDVPVEQLFARFVAAMREGQTQGAETALAALAEKLPAGSLGLLRAQAWFALKAGEDSAAADMYRQILERLPGDEEAAINLASIQSRGQQHEKARATLDASMRLQPDSAALRAALAQFTPNARP